jgi:hypothetical protein
MSNIRLLTVPGFKGGLFDLGVGVVYIKVFGMLNGFGPEFKVES